MDNIIHLNHRKSKLILCSTDYMSYVQGDDYFYVEAYHYRPIPNVCYLDMLAPSLELYEFVKDALYNKKITREDAMVFREQYNQQLRTRKAIRALERLEFYLEQGKSIVLFCDVLHLRFNHLILLGEYFKQRDYLIDYKFTLTSTNTKLRHVLVENIRDYL